MTARRGPRSKTVATWLALTAGSLGAHRFYLHGIGDALAWLLPLPTLAGAYGFWRMRELGVDDRLGNGLVPLLGITVAAAMLAAIVIGLTPEVRWQARWGAPPPSASDAPPSAWPVVIGVALALALGAAVTVATIAFVAQRYFESAAAGGPLN